MLFFGEQRLSDSLYITGDRISLAEVVAGSIIHSLPSIDIDLSNYPKAELWSNQLIQRPTWQATQPDPDITQDWLKRIQKLPKVRQRHWRQRRK